MTFNQARAISKTAKLHIRRAAWTADKWFMVWRGHWFVFPSGQPRTVQATDYDTDDLLATDWTTMPAALAACPIDPTIGSTGGGAPTPGEGGFPDDPTPPLLGGPGIPPGGGPSTTIIPPPAPGTGVSVTFAGIVQSTGLHTSVNPNLARTVALKATGSNTWTGTIKSGKTLSGDADDSIVFDVAADRSGDQWSVHVTCQAGFTPVFSTPGSPPFHRGDPIPNATATDSGDGFYAGTATVS